MSTSPQAGLERRRAEATAKTRANLEEYVYFTMVCQPPYPPRQVAEILGCSAETLSRYRRHLACSPQLREELLALYAEPAAGGGD